MLTSTGLSYPLFFLLFLFDSSQSSSLLFWSYLILKSLFLKTVSLQWICNYFVFWSIYGCDDSFLLLTCRASLNLFLKSVLTQVYYHLQWFYLEEQDTGGSVVNMSSTSTDVSESERAYRTTYVPPYFRSRTQLLYFAVPTPGNHLSFWAVP